MIILSFDSTAKVASVAVTKDGVSIAEYTVNNGLTQSELLLPMAEAMLNDLKLSFDDIGAYACSVGPGSFTGVRIGTALIKGLAFSRDLPCIGISSIEALAENLRGFKGLIVPVMDARRGQYYCGIFTSCGDNIQRLMPDSCISASTLSYEIKKHLEKDMPVYLVGDGYEGAKRSLSSLGINTECTPLGIRLQSAASIGILAEKYLEKGQYTNDKDLLPTYLRLPQAERERLEKEGKA